MKRILCLPEKLQTLQHCQRESSPSVNILLPEQWISGYALYAVPEWIWSRDHLLKCKIVRLDHTGSATSNVDNENLSSSPFILSPSSLLNEPRRVSVTVIEINSAPSKSSHARKKSSFTAESLLIPTKMVSGDIPSWIVKLFGECSDKRFVFENIDNVGSILLSSQTDDIPVSTLEPILIPSGDFDAILPTMIPFLNLYRLDLIHSIDLTRDINHGDFRKQLGHKFHLGSAFDSNKFGTELILEVLMDFMQNALYYFGFLSADYRDGILCDKTVAGLEQFFFASGPFDMGALEALNDNHETTTPLASPKSPNPDSKQLYTISSNSPWMQPGMFLILFENLISIQENLTHLGFPPPKGMSISDMNGFRKQIKHFQKARNLKMTMVLDHATMLRLKSDLRLYAEKHGIDLSKLSNPSHSTAGNMDGKMITGFEGGMIGLSRRLLKSSGAIGGLANKFGLLDDLSPTGVYRVDSFELSSTPLSSSSHDQELIQIRDRFAAYITECLDAVLFQKRKLHNTPFPVSNNTPQSSSPSKFRRHSDAVISLGPGPPFLLTSPSARSSISPSRPSISPVIFPNTTQGTNLASSSLPPPSLAVSSSMSPSETKISSPSMVKNRRGRGSSNPQQPDFASSNNMPPNGRFLHRRSPSVPSIHFISPSPTRFDASGVRLERVSSDDPRHKRQHLHDISPGVSSVSAAREQEIGIEHSPSRHHGQDILQSARNLLVKKPKKAAVTVFKGIVQPTAGMIGGIVKKTAAGVSHVVNSGVNESENDAGEEDNVEAFSHRRMSMPARLTRWNRPSRRISRLVSPMSPTDQIITNLKSPDVQESDGFWTEVDSTSDSEEEKEQTLNNARYRGRSLDRLLSRRPCQHSTTTYAVEFYRSKSLDRADPNNISSQNLRNLLQRREDAIQSKELSRLRRHYEEEPVPLWVSQAHGTLDKYEKQLESISRRIITDDSSNLEHISLNPILEKLSLLVQKRQTELTRLECLVNEMEESETILEKSLLEMERANAQVDYRVQSSSKALLDGELECNRLLTMIENELMTSNLA